MSFSTTPKMKQGRPRGSKNKTSKKQKLQAAAAVNDQFENEFLHIPVIGNDSEPAANDSEVALDEPGDFGLFIGPPGVDDDESCDDAIAEEEEVVCFGLADMYDVAELLELSNLDLKSNIRSEGNIETTDDLIKDLRSGCVSQSSKNLYESANILFLLYIYKFKTNLMHKTWIRTLRSFSYGVTDKKKCDKKLKTTLKKLLRKADETCPPIDFKTYSAKEFMMYLLSLETKNKKRLSSSSYSGKRSAYFHLCRIYSANQNEEFINQITILFKGLKRRIAREKQDGDGKIQTGKTPMSFPLYRRFCEFMLKDRTLESIWARAFFTMTWNLICRSTNTCTIHLHHMEWENDCLCIFFAHMKNDQYGDRKKDPRHVYSNPLDPVVCPILALAIYFSAFNISGVKGSQLFQGVNQYQRFSKYIGILCIRYKDEILKDFGVQIEDIGIHSLRKGAASYVSSGSTCAPPQVATNIRAGWSMGIIQDTYLRYESAGDQYVGQVISGLPLSSPKFSHEVFQK